MSESAVRVAGPGESAVRVEGLGKQYRLGPVRRRSNLRETIAAGAHNAMRRALRPTRGRSREADLFWALRDVSFDVERGEAVGIVGGNGAGKSTLLKILSHITEPTEGQAWIQGRVGSLLEVGTGFHMELTGRENIYLNGAILGMKRREIAARFDEIVDFAGGERFIDTPVKRYSTGMYLRLAFAIAAHMEPDVLLVDEVLAVGDAAFQQKCLGKMTDVARQGRTVLFVSHNMAAVQTLCSRAVLLRAGRVMANGPVAAVITTYLRSVEQAAAQALSERSDRKGLGQVRLMDVVISTDDPLPSAVLPTGCTALFSFRLRGRLPATAVWFTIFDQLGRPVSSFRSGRPGSRGSTREELSFTCAIADLPLVPGSYRINVEVYSDGDLQDQVEGAALFEVAAGVLHGRPITGDTGEGPVSMNHRWLLQEQRVRS